MCFVKSNHGISFLADAEGALFFLLTMSVNRDFENVNFGVV